MAQVASQVASTDVAVISLLSLALFDVLCSWESFSGCSQPVHSWLLGSYVLIVVSRLVHVAGTMSRSSCESEEFLLSARHSSLITRCLFWLTWLVLFPLFAAWTLLGATWLWDVARRTPQCFPSPAYPWFLVLWLLLCFVSLALHAWIGFLAAVVERRLRKEEADLRQLEDPDTVARWGELSRLVGAAGAGGGAAAAAAAEGGLSPDAIRALPGLSTVGEAGVDVRCGEDCPICLCELQHCDAARCLSTCGHTFHRSCIDLWLLRSASCPLCKAQVGELAPGVTFFV